MSLSAPAGNNAGAVAAADVLPPSPNLLTRQVIEPEAAWGLPDLREIWQFRDLLLTLAARDIKVRYKQTALGVIWIVLQPLLGAGILTFVFGVIGGFKSTFLISLAGMTVWNTFSTCLTRASSAMVGNQQLVSKVYFPRVLLPAATMISTLVDAAVMLTVLALLLVLRGQPPSPNVWLFPVFLVMALMLALGVGLFLTALAVKYRDVQHMLPMVTQVLLWGSPVAYTAALVAERAPKYRTYYFLNPLVGIIEGFRWSVVGTELPGWGWVGYSAAVCVALLLIGGAVFRRMEKEFADVI
jgi:lipopolysaccharide transport system permease protein